MNYCIPHILDNHSKFTSTQNKLNLSENNVTFLQLYTHTLTLTQKLEIFSLLKQRVLHRRVGTKTLFIHTRVAHAIAVLQ